jgi:dinuclear metal center YbgI/SA1388 family protein
MHCRELCDRFNEELRVEAYADLDASANGLQIGPDSLGVEHAAFAVDAAVETIEAAAAAEADLLVTHHGISFGGIERVTGNEYDRISAAIENDLALYAAHLPLDGHQELGNAAGLSDLLGLVDRSPFGDMGPEHVGQRGRAPEPLDLVEIQETLQAHLDTGAQDVRALGFGPEEISDVAIVTGSGVDWLEEAVETGADVLITGEGKQHVYHEAQEYGINLVLAGHYATETVGVENLQETAEQWGIETTFIDCPTGL